MSSRKSHPNPPREFATTHWSLVLNAGRDSSPLRDASLATLCEVYWYPLYAFVRRQGYDSSDAQDLTQGFFAKLLERGDLVGIDKSKGRFRSFLLAAMKHFLINEWDKQRAAKRGGGQAKLSLDFERAESRYSLEPSHTRTAEADFDREWALTMLDQVRSQLAQEHSTGDQHAQYEELQVYLTGERADSSYRDAGERLGMSEGAVKVAVHRLRRRFRELLREQIGQTVAEETEIDQEIADLFNALRAN